MVYAVSHAELNTNVLVGLTWMVMILGEKNLEVDWSWLTTQLDPVWSRLKTATFCMMYLIMSMLTLIAI